MADLIESLVLGLYAPIIFFSGLACWMLLTRLIIPSLRDRSFSLDRYAIALSAVFALAAHLTENTYYGAARWVGKFYVLNSQLLIVGAWKLLVLASAVLACAALSKATTDATYIARLTGVALSAWAVASVLAWVFV